MKILVGQCRRQSRKVMEKDLKRVITEGKRLGILCAKSLGKYRRALALCHCQVNHADPLRFFVLFNQRIIVNPRISYRGEELIKTP